MADEPTPHEQLKAQSDFNPEGILPPGPVFDPVAGRETTAEESAEDAVLAALEDGKDVREAEKEGRSALDKARKDKAKQSKEEGDAEAKGEEAGEEQSGDEEGEAKSPAYEKARKALERGIPKGMQELIDKLTDEQVIEMGLEMAAHQAEQDRVGNKKDQLEKGKEDEPGDDDGKGEEGDRMVAQPPTDPTIAKVLEPLSPELYGDELQPALTGMAGVLTEQAKGLMAAMQEGLETMFNEYVTDQVRRQHQERFPMLEDPKAWARVRVAMKELNPAMEYGEDDLIHTRTEKLLKRALQAEFPKEMASLPKKGSSRTDPRDDGQPAAGGRKPPRKQLSADEQESLWLEQRESTGSARAASEAAGFR